MIHRLAAHAVQRGCGVFDVILDLVERKRIGGCFIPIGFAVHIRKAKADLFRMVAPMRPLCYFDLVHPAKLPRKNYRGFSRFALAMPVCFACCCARACASHKNVR